MNSWGKSLLALALIGGCAGDTEIDEKPAIDQTKADDVNTGKSEAWGASDAPSIFGGSLEYSLAALPATGQATNVPWAGNYWPTYQDNINYRWAGASTQSPAAKYGQAFGVAGVEDAVSQYHGIDAQSGRKECSTNADCSDQKDGSTCAKRVGASKGRCIPTWWGICHAWTPAAILLPEPKYPVTKNGVTFKIQDIKALVSLVHNNTSSKFVSLRCNKDHDANEINFDNYGRPSSTSAECRDTNAGTYHVLLTNYLGLRGQAFAEDRTFDDEVWNQPIRAYRIKKQVEVTPQQANVLIGVVTGGTTANKSGSVAQGAWSHQGSFPVAAGQTVKVVMTGTGDADLYVNFGSQPTTSTYACRPYADGSAETCELSAPAGATAVFVSVNGYTASSFNLAITTGGSAPTTYPFNSSAAKLYDVVLEVDYIGESSASTDGNLSGVINQYTHTDHYEYILEVDGAGKIIGGEWVGASKTAHPDFLWLPTGVSSQSVAGGKITYANVKALLDESLVAPGGGGTGTQKTVSESNVAVAKGAWKHYGPYNVAGGTTLTATISGTGGDADLYVRKGATPTLAAYDCRPYQNGSNENCAVVSSGTPIYVSVYGYEAATVNVQIKYTEGTGGGPGPTPTPTFTHLDTSGSVAQGEMKVFQLPIPAGKKVVVRTTSAADVDLYILMDAAPTTSTYTARGYTDSGNETLTFTASSNGTLYIGVHGYQAGSFTLKTTDN